jgi:AraC-like DNA-binding protein
MEATPEELALRDEAAAEAHSRIRADRARTSERLQGLLAHLEEHLFDESLDVTRWFRACGVRAHSIRESFQSELELAPLAYLRRHRILAARRLLTDSDLGVWRIAKLVGYRRADAFRDAFRQETATTPLRFRRQSGRRSGKGPSHRLGQELARMREWRQATLGAAPPELHAKLAEKLLADYPFLHRDRGSRFERKLEEELAETVYRNLADYDFADQKTLARLQVGFRTTALFDLLRKKSLEEGRLDRRRGVELAHVALASLDAIADDLGADLPNRKAEGLVCLANAHWLAEDYDEAENGFDSAKIELRRASGHLDPLVEAELWMHEAGLNWYRRRFETALTLVDRAIPVFYKYRQQVLMANAVILKGGIYLYADQPEAAVIEIRRGLEHIEEKEKPYLALSAHSGLTVAHRLIGERGEAEKALAQGFALAETVGSELAKHQLEWSSGLLRHEQGDCARAEELLCTSADGFSEANELGYTAIVLLDLALLHAEQGRSATVVQVAARALPLLEALKLNDEARTASHLLREAVTVEKLSISVLQGVRDAISKSRGDLQPRARSEQERRAGLGRPSPAS